MSSSIRDSIKIGKRSVRSSITIQVLKSRKNACAFEPEVIDDEITSDDEKLIRTIKKLEKDVSEELKEKKTMSGYVVYVQGANESGTNRYQVIPRSSSRSLCEYTPCNDKIKFKAIRETVQKFNASIRISKSDDVNLIIVNDSFMSMKTSKLEKKREKKYLEKRRSMGYENKDPESLQIHDNKKILKFYEQHQENMKIISAKRFLSLSEVYLKPFSVDFHKECGVPISKGEDHLFFSVTPFEDKRYKKYRKSLKRKAKSDYHQFTENRFGKPDVHKLVTKSSGNVPIFLDERERNYLRSHIKELKEKFIKMVDHLRIPKKVEKDIPIPTPPKEHKNCIVCFKVYEDFIEHVEGKSHAGKANSELYKEDYKTIDILIDRINIEFNSSRINNNKECNPILLNEVKVNPIESKIQNVKESCTKSDCLTADNTDEKSIKIIAQEYDEYIEVKSYDSHSKLYCVIDSSISDSCYLISQMVENKKKQEFEVKSKSKSNQSSEISFVYDDKEDYSSIQNCVVELSLKAK